jgi:hypothetical protein
MTLPNRRDYVPGERRRAKGERRRGVEAASGSDSGSSGSGSDAEGTADTSSRCERGMEELRMDVRALLEAVAPARSKRARQQRTDLAMDHVAGPDTVAQRKQAVLAAWRRLKDDEGFEYMWSRVSLCSLMAAAGAVDGRDAFEEALEQLPHAAVDVPDAAVSGLDVACLDGVLVTDDGSIRTKFERVAGQLLEWSRRRLALDSPGLEHVPEPPRSTSPTEMLKEGIVAVNMVKEKPPASPRPAQTLASYGFDLSANGSKTKRRATLNGRAKEMLRVWFEAHVHHPYPTEEEKEWLAREGGITLEQVNNWFINTRGRKWKPMLNRLMAEKQKGECKLLDEMVQRMTEPYQREL